MIAETRSVPDPNRMEAQRLPQPRTLRPGPQAMLLFVTLTALYGLTMTRLNTFDAVAYANQITLAERTGTMRGLFHPHHLLFNALGFVVWRAVHALGYSGGPLAVLTHINAVWGAAGIALFFLTLRRLVPRWAALTAALLLAGSFGWWICATDGRVNMPSDVLLLAAFALLAQTLRTPTLGRAVGCGLVSGLAVLFHESAGLFLVVGWAGMALASPRGRASRCAAFSLSWPAMVLLPYLYVSVRLLHLHSLGEFRHWADSYAEQGQWWDFHLLRNMGRDGYALRHACFVEPPGRAAVGLDAAHSWLGRLWRTLALIALHGLYVGAVAGWLAALGFTTLTIPRLRRTTYGPLVMLCLLWMGVTAAFFTVWCPGYFVFWVPALVPLLVLLALTATYWRRRLPFLPLRPLVRAWILLIVLVNACCSIAPHLRPNQSLWQRVARDARAHTDPHALLIVPGAGPDGQSEVQIPYFADRACLSIHETWNQARTTPQEAPRILQNDITRALLAGRRVYVYAEIWQDPKTVQALEAHHPGLTPQSLAAGFAGFRQYPAWLSPRGPVLRLRLDKWTKHGV